MAMYSRSHCLTRMLNEAVDRLNMRLANQHTFTRMSTVPGWNAGFGGDPVRVELRNPDVTVYPLVWDEISWRSWIMMA